MADKVLEHPRYTAEKIYQEHKATCPECSLPPPGETLRVMDLCNDGKILWAKARGRESLIGRVFFEGKTGG